MYCLQMFASKVNDWPEFASSVWRERKKKLEVKQAALANEAAAAASQDVDSPTAGQSSSQVHTTCHSGGPVATCDCIHGSYTVSILNCSPVRSGWLHAWRVYSAMSLFCVVH